jgi:ribose 5-phosphate isomerase A
MDQDELKRAVAAAAMAYVEPGMVLGVGTGTTADFFIGLLASSGIELEAVVPSSDATAAQLAAAGLPLADLPSAPAPSLYVDGADQVDPRLRLIKGRGGAHFREKLVASLSERFICIVDESKLAPQLGGVPVPVEVVEPAAAFVAARLAAMGGTARLRRGFVTDNGNPVLDVTGLDLTDPEGLEVELDALPGVVECGIFARRPADLVLCGGSRGVRVIEPSS